MAIEGLSYIKKEICTVEFDGIFVRAHEVKDFNFHKGQR